MPLLAISVIALFGFVALAIDLGMMMVARTECQDAADAAALAGTRMLDNRYPANTNPDVYDNNRDFATQTAKTVVTSNIFLNTPFTSNRVTAVNVGVYSYNPTAQVFMPSYPFSKPAGQSWSAVHVEVNGDQPAYFSKLFGLQTMPMSARATAVHRPRDIALVLDFSGSMKFSSTTHWEPGSGGSNGEVRGLLNPDPNYPQFGHYQRYTAYQNTNPVTAATSGSIAARPNPLQMTGTFIMQSGEVAAPNNHTIDGRNGPAVVKDFYFDPANSSNPAVPITAVYANNLRPAFQRWNPVMTNPGDPNNYIAPTYSYGGYNAFDLSNSSGPTPAPDSFRDQSDQNGIQYVGDRYPRKRGVYFTSSTSWDPASANGAARNLVELLNLPTALNTTRQIPASRPVISNGNTIEGGSSPTNFYDDGWERNGYDLNESQYVTTAYQVANAMTPVFQSYSMGPGYWGKTFFIWPPDPRFSAGVDLRYPDPGRPCRDYANRWMCDWRRRFFLRADGNAFDPQADNDPVTAGVQSINEVLLNPGTNTTNVGSHVLNDASKYQINYPALLAWIKTGPQTLPPNLRSGRTVYYTSIPSDVDTTTGSTAEQLDKRFWKEYIDFVMGRTGVGVGYDPRYNLAGVEYLPWPEGSSISIGNTSSFDPDGTGPKPANPRPYMNYSDSPNRPRMNFWFGPTSMMAFLGTRSPYRNWWSGTTHEAQAWQLKIGIDSGLQEIRNNHPNDQAGLCYFAHPNYNSVQVPMSQSWTDLRNALYYPLGLLPVIGKGDTSTEVRPYNAGFGSAQVGMIPNANGGTDPNTGFAMAYNLLSSRPTTTPGLTGRRGAAKIVIFETDGVPNAMQTFSYIPNGVNSYYSWQNTGYLTANGDSTVMNEAYRIVQQITANVNATPGASSGFSLPSAPARVYAIAFGDLFDSATNSSLKPAALNFLLRVQLFGNTSAFGETSIPSYQIITGPFQTRINNLQNALERILQSGVQVTLIE